MSFNRYIFIFVSCFFMSTSYGIEQKTEISLTRACLAHAALGYTLGLALNPVPCHASESIVSDMLAELSKKIIVSGSYFAIEQSYTTQDSKTYLKITATGLSQITGYLAGAGTQLYLRTCSEHIEQEH